MNQVIVMGRLGKDLELKTTDKGVQYVFGSIAVDESYRKDGIKVDKTVWVAFTLYDKAAENAVKYVGKGNRVILTGKLDTKQVEGAKYPELTFKALHMQYVDFKDKADAATGNTGTEQPF